MFGPWIPLGLRLQTPYRGPACYPPHIIRPDDAHYGAIAPPPAVARLDPKICANQMKNVLRKLLFPF